VTDPLNHVTANQYDSLNRLKQVTDAKLGVTQYAYDGLGALTQITDPRSLVTGYTVDGRATAPSSQARTPARRSAPTTRPETC
jgi:YD repeat-containing protein